MSKGYRDGAFALGLIVGGGAVLNLFLWSAYLANKKSETKSQANENANGEQIVDFWSWLVGTFVDPYDTLAQWAMAILSLAAVYLLWETLKASRRTLKATQKMALDTREIGEAQVRAYVSIEKVRGGISIAGEGRVVMLIWLKLANSGQSPARNVEATVTSKMFRGTPETIGFRDIASEDADTRRFTRGIEDRDLAFIDADQTRIGLSIDIEVAFQDVFAKGYEKTRFSETFIGEVMLVHGESFEFYRPDVQIITIGNSE